METHGEQPARRVALIRWADAESPGCSASFASLDDFREEAAGFAMHGQQREGTPHSVFVAPDLRRYQLRRALPARPEVVTPENVREWLGWSNAAAERTVGAHPTQGQQD